MALVSFRVSGAAADQSLEHRLFQIGGHTIKVRQNPAVSGVRKPNLLMTDLVCLLNMLLMNNMQHLDMQPLAFWTKGPHIFYILEYQVACCIEESDWALIRGCSAQGSGAHQHIGVHSDSTSEVSRGGSSEENLENVGLVVWQSAFVLAEFLMAHPPLGAWHDVRAVDLGTGTGDQFY